MITFVCGFPRCGSSLTMQMLNAAGLRCPGKFPAFEVAWWSPDAHDVTKATQYDAVKWLSPHLDPPRAQLPECRIVWVDRRDVAEQAKSHAKYVKQWLRGKVTRQQRGMIASDIRHERNAAVEYCSRISGGLVLVETFEDLIADPIKEAARLAAFVGQGDPEKMAACAFERGPACLPTMLEEEIARHGKR